MRLWTTTEFTGHYPVGTAAVVVAETVEQAFELMREQLKRHSLDHTQGFGMREIPATEPAAYILCDGNY
jgi:hypothetical protein